MTESKKHMQPCSIPVYENYMLLMIAMHLIRTSDMRFVCAFTIRIQNL